MILNLNSNNIFLLKEGCISTKTNSTFNYKLTNEMLSISDLSVRKEILYTNQAINKDSNILDVLLNMNTLNNKEKISTKLVLNDIKFDLIFINNGQIIIEDDLNIKNLKGYN